MSSYFLDYLFQFFSYSAVLITNSNSILYKLIITFSIVILTNNNV